MKKSEKELARVLVESLNHADEKTVTVVAEDLVRELGSRRELHRLRGLLDAMDHAWAKRHGAATISVETAYPLSDVLRKKIEKIADGAELRERVIPELIGGARLRVDEKIIDGTIEGSLEQLSRVLADA